MKHINIKGKTYHVINLMMAICLLAIFIIIFIVHDNLFSPHSFVFQLIFVTELNFVSYTIFVPVWLISPLFWFVLFSFLWPILAPGEGSGRGGSHCKLLHDRGLCVHSNLLPKGNEILQSLQNVEFC